MKSDRIRYWAKKIKYTNYLGGKCLRCGNSNIHVLDFHHRIKIDKKFIISQKIDILPFDEIVKELDKCILLCKNCHREEHFKDSINNTKSKELKINYLHLLNITKCNECGYDKCNNALEFHHINRSDKKFVLSNKFASKIIDDSVILELGKCLVLCANCHKLIHSDTKFFNNNLPEIINKSNNLEYRCKLDYDEILQLHQKGNSITEISKILNKNKSSISTAIKKLGISPCFTLVEDEDVIKLHSEGFSNIEIAKKLNRNKTTIFAIVKKLKLKPNHSKNKKTNRKDVNVSELVELLKTNSLTSVSKRMNISRQTIYNILNNKR